MPSLIVVAMHFWGDFNRRIASLMWRPPATFAPVPVPQALAIWRQVLIWRQTARSGARERHRDALGEAYLERLMEKARIN